MRQLEIVEPQSVEEAVGFLDPNDASIRPISGGTALMLMMKAKIFEPTTLVSLRRVKDDLRGIEVGTGGELRIRAMTSLRELERSSLVRRFSPVLADAMQTLSNVRVRNVATVGGHIAHADPHMDLPPILLALDASIRVVGKNGSRVIQMSDLFKGYYETTLGADELITELVVPHMEVGIHGTYRKATALSADDWPMVGVATFFGLENGRMVNPRVSVSAATEKPVRLLQVEALLNSELPSVALFQEAANLAAAEVKPLADIRGSAAYKREMIRVYVKRALFTALEQRGAGRGEGHA